MKRFICFLLVLPLAVPAFAGDGILGGKIENAIREYVINKNPLWQDASLKVDFALNQRIEKRLASYGDKLSFIIPEIYANSKITPNIILPLQVLEDGVERERIYIRTRLGLYKNVVAAAKPLKKGEIFTSDKLEEKNENVLLLSGEYFSSLSAVLGKQARGYVPAGSAILGSMIMTIPDIAKNQQVFLSVRSDGLEIKAKGVALQDGYIGDIIRVKRENNNEIIKGKVSSAGQVEIEL